MSQKYAVASGSVADTGPGRSAASVSIVGETILSQYAASPVLMAIIERLADAFDADADIDLFYDAVWNVATARGYGLDVLGRIVGVSRVLRIPLDARYLGWQQQPEATPFGDGPFFNGSISTRNFLLTDDAYRRLILAKAALNICDGSIPAINSALLALFPDRGNSYVRDDGGMAMTYVFGSDLTPVEYAIVAQAGVLLKPIGVSVSGAIAG